MTHRWWLDEPRLCLSWDLWYGCNYRCSYCWWEMEDLWADLAKRHKILPPEEWISIWGRVRERHGEARLDVLGGEPLLYPKASELWRGLAGLHRLLITTNLSISIEKLRELMAAAPPERLHLNASFHPQFSDQDEFLEKLLLLHSKGYEPGVLLVTWPPLVAKMPEYAALFKKWNLPFTPMVFQGRWEGESYPEAFDEDQKRVIESLMGNAGVAKEDELKYRLLRESTRGKPCNAGRVYANVKADGSVYRCGQDAFGHQPLGNIFDSQFNLFEKPEPCPYEKCSCLEFKYLDEIDAPRPSRSP